MQMDGVPLNPKTLKQICTWSLLLAFGFPFFSLLALPGSPPCRHSLTETHPLVSSCILHLCHPLSVKRLVLPALSVRREELNKTSFMGFLGRVMMFNWEMCDLCRSNSFFCRSPQLVRVKESRLHSFINQSSERKHDANFFLKKWQKAVAQQHAGTDNETGRHYQSSSLCYFSIFAEAIWVHWNTKVKFVCLCFCNLSFIRLIVTSATGK